MSGTGTGPAGAIPGNWSTIGTSLQGINQGIIKANQALDRLVPANTSGQLVADALVQTGLVRLLGVSVIVAGSSGTLRDAATLAVSASTDDVYTLPLTTGFYPVQMIFAKGLVYKAGSGETIALFYSRI